MGRTAAVRLGLAIIAAGLGARPAGGAEYRYTVETPVLPDGAGSWWGVAFVTAGDAFRQLTPPESATSDIVIDISDAGEALWLRGNQPMLMNAAGESTPLAITGIAEDLVNDGAILSAVIGTDAPHYAIIYRPDLSVEATMALPDTHLAPRRMNQRHEVTGLAAWGGAQAAFWYHDGAVELLPSLWPDSYMDTRSMNNGGDIVGWSWDGHSARTVGTLWENGVPIDVNSLIDPGLGWEINDLLDVNDQGVIVGKGFFSGQELAVILTPIPEPRAAFALVVLAALVTDAPRGGRNRGRRMTSRRGGLPKGSLCSADR
jgi:hypothetical protein